jgi:hypothetical protein
VSGELADLRVDAEGGGARLALRVRPGGRRDRIAGLYGERLKVEVSAAPEKGKANEALRRLLASALGVRREAVEIVAGAASQDKVVRVSGLEPAELRRRLAEAL